MSKLLLQISIAVIAAFFLILLISLITFIDTDTEINNDEALQSIRFVNILFRHGDRSPNYIYPNDPHANYPWRGGLGALSKKGSVQMFNLGKHLHKRYKQLLPKNGLYSNDKMQILSSAVERCMMSAASFLAGFMPPLDEHNGLPIKWQPVPIETIPIMQDNLIVQIKECPKYDVIIKNLINNTSESIIDYNRKNQELYKFLTKHTGSNITNIFDVEKLYDILQIQKNAGLQLPAWTKVVFPDKMKPSFLQSSHLRTETMFMKKIKGGTVLTEFLKNMENYKYGQTNKTIYIYSGHDITIHYLMSALNLVNQTAVKPDYAATVAFELHQNDTSKDDDFEIKIFYYQNSDNQFPIEINIPNCKSPCLLTNFKKTYENVLIYDYDESCKL